MVLIDGACCSSAPARTRRWTRPAAPGRPRDPGQGPLHQQLGRWPGRLPDWMDSGRVANPAGHLLPCWSMEVEFEVLPACEHFAGPAVLRLAIGPCSARPMKARREVLAKTCVGARLGLAHRPSATWWLELRRDGKTRGTDDGRDRDLVSASPWPAPSAPGWSSSVFAGATTPEQVKTNAATCALDPDSRRRWGEQADATFLRQAGGTDAATSPEFDGRDQLFSHHHS